MNISLSANVIQLQKLEDNTKHFLMIRPAEWNTNISLISKMLKGKEGRQLNRTSTDEETCFKNMSLHHSRDKLKMILAHLLHAALLCSSLRPAH